MTSSDVGFELRPSALWTLLPAGLGGIILLLASKDIADRAFALNVQLLGGLLYVGVVPLWLLLRRDVAARKAMAVAALTLDVTMATLLLRLPEAITLLSLVIALCAAVLSLRAAAALAVVQTLLVTVFTYTIDVVTPPIALITLFSMWGVFGTMVVVYQPMYKILDWSWAQYKRSQAAIDDVRERRAELEQTLKDLAHANRQLALGSRRMAGLRAVAESLERGKSAFVARVSHEFRAPLNMIIGLVGLMVDRPEVYASKLSPELQADLAVIHRNSSHLAEMINDVLDLTQAESGRLSLRYERVDLRILAIETGEAISPLVDKKGLTLTLDLPDEPIVAECDRTRIRQVMLNLVSNAARFTDAGRVDVRVTGEDGEIRIEVSDTGPGIPGHMIDHLFEPFCRLGTRSQCQGLGERPRPEHQSGDHPTPRRSHLGRERCRRGGLVHLRIAGDRARRAAGGTGPPDRGRLDLAPRQLPGRSQRGCGRACATARGSLRRIWHAGRCPGECLRAHRVRDIPHTAGADARAGGDPRSRGSAQRR